LNQVVHLILAFTAGLVLGLFYFGGLWLTVQRLPRARHPGVLAAVSLLVRTGLTLVGFYLIMAGRWERLAFCLVGFFLVRIFLVRRLGPGQGQTLAK